jgi:hypothetical protein
MASLFGVASLVVSIAGTGAVPAGASPAGSVSISQSRSVLPSSGGFDELTETAAGATRCAIDVAQLEGLTEAKTVLFKQSSCPGGRLSTLVFLPANSSGATETYSVLALAWFGNKETHVFSSARVLPAERITGQAAPPPPPAGGLPAASVLGPRSVFLLSRIDLPSYGGAVLVSYDASGATSCRLTSVPRLWSGYDPVTVRCNGWSQISVPASEQARAWTLSFAATGANGRTTVETRTLSQSDVMTSESGNWSGYVVSSLATIPTASGEWTVPDLNCSATPNSSESTWVGTGGDLVNQELLQTGVTDQCVDGAQQDYPWWEMVPMKPNYSIPFSEFLVFPGDVVKASVYRSALTGAWTTRLDNLTTGWSGWMVTGEGWGVARDGAADFAYQGTAPQLTYPGATTAEWIVEAPTSAANGQIESLADYGSVTFSDLLAGLSSWSLTPQDGVEIGQGSSVLSVPALPDGDGFSVSYAS